MYGDYFIMHGGAIQQKWTDGFCRIEDGIFFGNDEVIPLDGDPDSGFTFEARTSVATILAEAPDYWCYAWRGASALNEHHGVTVHAGGTPWEGDGFVAVVAESTGLLVWLLHLSTSEEFVDVVVDGYTIRATSGGYPVCYEWSIPILAPEKFTVQRRRA